MPILKAADYHPNQEVGQLYWPQVGRFTWLLTTVNFGDIGSLTSRLHPTFLAEFDRNRLVGNEQNMLGGTGPGGRIAVPLVKANTPKRTTLDGAQRLAFHPARPPLQPCGNESVIP